MEVFNEVTVKLKIVFQSVIMFLLVIIIIISSVILLDYYFDFKRKNTIEKPRLVLNGTKITITNNKLTLIGRDTIYELYLEYVK